MTPRCDATIHIFPLSPEARFRLVMRNLEAVLEEQRRSIAGMRDAFVVVSETTADQDDVAPAWPREHAALP